MNTDLLLNNFACRCFRDSADGDYIAARLAYKHHLFSQFHWLSLQALEKYLKAILLFNRVVAKDINHDLDKALEYCEQLKFEIRLSEVAIKFIEHIGQFGRFRYLEVSYHLYGPKLMELDRTVWELRRYCDALDYDIEDSEGKKINMLSVYIQEIEKIGLVNPVPFMLHGGLLERIIQDTGHVSRNALIWQNGFFGKRLRRFVKMRTHHHAKNSPLSLHPELLDEVEKFIFLPKEVKEAYRKRIAEEKKERN